MANDLLISGVQTLPRSESDVRYNYYNTNQIIGGANINAGNQAQLYSSDGGQSWGQSVLPSQSPDVRQSDPAVDWTSDGNAWALTIGITASMALTVRCFKSIDGGQSWKHESDLSSSVTQPSVDKPAFWVDHSPTSPYKDHMYATWYNGAIPYAAWRAGTAGTWSAPIQLSGSETTVQADGQDIKSNTYGDVFAFWPSRGNQTMLMAKSTNGGTSFGTPVKITTTFATFLVPIPAQDLRECLMYISGGAYKTATLDMVYAIWMDLEGGSGCSALSNAPGGDVTSACKTRIWFSSSADGGAHWSAPVMLNNQSSKNDQFFPRLAVDETNGNMMVVYYDTVADSGRVKADVWMQSSVDNGATWTLAVKITSTPTSEASDEDLDNQFGDYIGLTGYGGQFFACWTDRRDAGLEQIYGSPIVLPFAYFTVDKNIFGVDEVNVDSNWSNDFWVVVEGASPNSLGSNKPTLAPGGFNALTPTVQLLETHSGPLPFPTYEQPTELDTPQRISFPYTVVFSGTPAPPFPIPGGSPIVYPLNGSISFQGRSGVLNLLNLPEVAFELTAGEDPYFQNVDPSIDNEPYLSQDLRVFTIVPGWPPLANAMPGAPAFVPTNTSSGPIPFTAQDPAAAYAYIQSLLGYLKDNFSDGASPDPFASLLDQGQSLTSLSSVTPSFPDLFNLFGPPFIGYNFAIARVRLKAASGSTATGVKVFFRLWTTQSTDTDYDPSFTYLSVTDAAGLPTTPLPGPANVTYPFLASGDYSAASINADYGTDGDPNYHDITTGSMDTGYGYFGCFLNLYDLNVQLHVTNAGTHHCLVAQIAYDDAPIPIYPGASPTVSSMDKLAQRNLQISGSDNPGPPSAHRIPQSFDLRPSPVVASTARGIAGYPDELQILWGNVPRGTKASIYWPQVDSAAVLGLASRLYAGPVWSATDAHTVQCTVDGDVTYLPIPAGTGGNFSGLFTLDLPTTVVRGEIFNVVVHRIGTWRSPQGNVGGNAGGNVGGNAGGNVGGNVGGDAGAGGRFGDKGRGPGDWRYIIGSFQVQIPVATAASLLAPEESKLAILKWRLSRMALTNRWYPVLKRLVGFIGERVRGLGGNPVIIKGSPWGYHPGPGVGGSGHGGSGHGGSGGHGGHGGSGHGAGGSGHGVHGDFLEYTGKVCGILYDRFGDFEGFNFRDEAGHEHSFHGRESEVERLVYKAWEERIVVSIRVAPHAPHWPASIIYRRPSTF